MPKLHYDSCQLDVSLDRFSAHLDAQLEIFELRLTLRFGIMLAAGVAAFVFLTKLG